MHRLIHPFWIGFTIILTLIFIILFPTAIISQYGPIKTAFFTLIGVSVIWAVYFVRAHIFSKLSSEEAETKKNQS